MLLAGCTHSFGVSMRLPQVEERLLGHGARYCLDSTGKKGGKWKQRAQGDRQRKQIVFFPFFCVFGGMCARRGVACGCMQGQNWCTVRGMHAWLAGVGVEYAGGRNRGQVLVFDANETKDAPGRSHETTLSGE